MNRPRSTRTAGRSCARRTVTIGRSLAAIMLAMLAPHLPGCAGPQVVAASYAVPPEVGVVAHELPVVHITRRLDERRGYGGSGVALAPDTLITCRHVVPPDTQEIQINGLPVRIEPLAFGEGEEAVDDWIVLALRSARLPQVPATQVRHDWRGQPGQRVYIAGFPGAGNAAPGGPDQLTVVWGTVVSARPGPAADAGMTFLRMPEGTYHGLSGGAAAVVDEQTGEIELVGVYTGRWARAFGPWRWDTTGLVQPIPAEHTPTAPASHPGTSTSP